jgi:hypothetical protein
MLELKNKMHNVESETPSLTPGPEALWTAALWWPSKDTSLLLPRLQRQAGLSRVHSFLLPGLGGSCLSQSVVFFTVCIWKRGMWVRLVVKNKGGPVLDIPGPHSRS